MLGKLMVDDWRIRWKQPEMPFYYVQLSSIDTLQYKSQLLAFIQRRAKKDACADSFFRDGSKQRSGSQNDVHPVNKKDIGERLAAWALNKPIIKKSAIRVRFH